ncbi:MAG: hypothetical protein JWP37_3036 [Mucilaginibacter sp.]|nr:hypothetical protein [Mucilaginibacter sp.]
MCDLFSYLLLTDESLLYPIINYDNYTNRLISETIIKAGNPEKPVQLMAHLLAAQQIWLNRCKGEPNTGSVFGPIGKLTLLSN